MFRRFSIIDLTGFLILIGHFWFLWTTSDYSFCSRSRLPAPGSWRYQTFSTSWKWKGVCQFSRLKWGDFPTDGTYNHFSLVKLKFTVADWLCLKTVQFFHHRHFVSKSQYLYNKLKYLSPEGLWVVNGGW